MVRRYIIVFIAIGFISTCSGQDLPPDKEDQLELLAGSEIPGKLEDLNFPEGEEFRKKPLNLNTADANQLRLFPFLSELQINSLISYRNLIGHFIHIYELQAVPGLDIVTIRKFVPYITLTAFSDFPLSLKTILQKGKHSLLLRISQTLERSSGFNKNNRDNGYLGSPQHILFRYRYKLNNKIQLGICGDKDAGEPFFNNVQRAGFDFYTYHLVARRMGLIECVALGDFTVNMGQGLIQWQGLAFNKSAAVMEIKRQSDVIRPYSSSGENFFHRGTAVTIKKGSIESSIFFSQRKLSGNLINDTVYPGQFISSISSSGYHRTPSEIADRNNFTQYATGVNFQYKKKKGHFGVNAVYYRFSRPLQKSGAPYNYYAIKGTNWYNAGVDYSYTLKNLHFFGEAALDRNFNKAILNGILLSADARVTVSLLHRAIQKSYQAVSGDAFTENNHPTNEKGLYAGITLTPSRNWKLDFYADFFKFPWLKFGVSSPSRGSDFLLQLTYTPNKKAEFTSRFRIRNKEVDKNEGDRETDQLIQVSDLGWRNHVHFSLSQTLSLRYRADLLWSKRTGLGRQEGFLTYMELLIKPREKPISGTARIQYFQTEGSGVRMYAYERDVSYSFSIPSFEGTGYRFYFLLNYDISKNLSCWIRLEQSGYQSVKAVGSDLDEIPGNRKTGLKIQCIWAF